MLLLHLNVPQRIRRKYHASPALQPIRFHPDNIHDKIPAHFHYLMLPFYPHRFFQNHCFHIQQELILPLQQSTIHSLISFSYFFLLVFVWCFYIFLVYILSFYLYILNETNLLDRVYFLHINK